ncbi:MAG: S16 family serine protease [Candidatus Burarchaeum sp.]|nr:S16 family serine protease [Candidatus Burarchaeum sp.]MDO8340130.1 S16 family serine protease [Candidatus Burarchaeum sp.]
MRPTALIILALALLSEAGMAYAECPSGSASIMVPAVAGEEGKILMLSVESMPGHGEVFMSTAPYVGLQTQNSERIAVSVAAWILEQNASECDFLFRIGGDVDETEAVDGPSAGAAMTLVVLSALSNTSISNTVSMTGTIELDGSIGPVGGVSAKARAAAKEGANIFLTPKLEMYERLLLSGVHKNYDIRVIEVQDIFEAAAIVLGGEVPLEKNRTYRGTELPEDLDIYAILITPQVARFAKIANDTLDDTVAEVAQAKLRGNGEFDAYFEGEMNATRTLLDKKYHYTGANIAFLAGVDARIVGRPITEAELKASISDVEACLAGLRKPALYQDNAEEVFGGEVRMTWARQKLDDVLNMSGEGEDMMVYKLRELDYAKGWCTLAGRLYDYGGAGEKLNEQSLRLLAKEKLEAARQVVLSEDSDVGWHLMAAEEAYDAGNYGAAVYDSAYSIGMTMASEELINQTPESLKKRVGGFVAKEVGGLWPNLYKMQVQYYSKEGSTDLATAFRMAQFVKELEKNNDEAMKILIAAKVGEMPEPQATMPVVPVQENGQLEVSASARDAFALLAILGLLLVIAYEVGEIRGEKHASI